MGVPRPPPRREAAPPTISASARPRTTWTEILESPTPCFYCEVLSVSPPVARNMPVAASKVVGPSLPGRNRPNGRFRAARCRCMISVRDGRELHDRRRRPRRPFKVSLFRRPTPSKFTGTLFRNTKPQVRMFPAVVGARSLAVLKVRREPVLPELGCPFKLGHLPRARSSRENPEFHTEQVAGVWSTLCVVRQMPACLGCSD